LKKYFGNKKTVGNSVWRDFGMGGFYGGKGKEFEEYGIYLGMELKKENGI
jgi:hypothetical protein